MNPFSALGLAAFLRSSLAFSILIAYGLDLVLADPPNWPHPVKGMGFLIQRFERALLNPAQPGRLKKRLGFLPALIIPAGLAALTQALITALYFVSPIALIILRIFVIYQLLAAGGLARAAWAVAKSLKRDGLAVARSELAKIVGRDTAQLNSEQIITATVETVAENFSDGVVAPLFFLALFDLPGMVFYKAVNTLDSMLGYKNERYLDFGYASAKLDDLLNFIPARIAAFCLLLASLFSAENSARALRIYWRDRKQHSSPNSGQTEAVAAGALGLSLGGPNYYQGKLVEKPRLGDAIERPVLSHIRRINKLHYIASTIAVLLAIIFVRLVNIV
ncbi:MAG: adenosylcobinamide-phosphate synthase CbiB [Eubacteriales bacterium]|nr:adenosylcobinamide-phosphate synthase CbiB [Eubacteriales bacterium]